MGGKKLVLWVCLLFFMHSFELLKKLSVGLVGSYPFEGEKLPVESVLPPRLQGWRKIAGA